MDLRTGVAAVPATQATHPNSSRKVINISISVSTSSSIRSSFLSSSSSSYTVRTIDKEEISTNARTTRHIAFLPQQPIRSIRQRQRKEEVVDVSAVGNRVTGRIIAQRRQLNHRQLSTL